MLSTEANHLSTSICLNDKILSIIRTIIYCTDSFFEKGYIVFFWLALFLQKYLPSILATPTKLSERVKDITVNQLVNSDISWAQNYIEKENLRGHKLSMRVIRPLEPLKLDMLSFSSDDIVRLILEGFKIGFEGGE